MRPCFIVIAIVLVVVLSGGCTFNTSKAQVTQQLAAPYLAGTAMAVHSRNGSVDVVGGSTGDQVQIEARITCSGATQLEADQRLAATFIDISRAPDQTLVIKPVFAGGERGNDQASFTIQVPAVSGITVDTSNGRVALRNLSGAAEIDTSNGAVTVVDHNGPVSVDTSNGAVTATRLHGTLTVGTSNGSVEAHEISGPATISSSNGSIRLVMSPDATGPINLRTSNGSVKATIGPQFAGAVDMDTSNGSLRIADPRGRITSSNLARNDGSITVGSGGQPSRIVTSNGRIELEIAD